MIRKLDMEQMQTAIDSLQIGVWNYDFGRDELFTNDIIHQLFGVSEKIDLELNHFAERIYSEDKGAVFAVIQDVLNKKGKFRCEFRLKQGEEHFSWVSLQGELIADSAGQLHRGFGTVMDITERRLSEELHKETLFYRDEFLSIASHELKTPLTSLKLQSQIFLRAVKRNDPSAYAQERITRFVEQAERQVGRMVRLVDDMLDISRIRTGKLTIVREKQQLGQLVEEVLKRLGPQFIESYGHTAQIDELASGAVMCDRGRIEQVVSNLVSNALRYGNGLPVKISVTKSDNFFEIIVVDQGMGIAPENHEKIFMRFKRAVPASEISGLGLGLYIAKQVVELHGGSISLQSQVGQGATFTVRLPLG